MGIVFRQSFKNSLINYSGVIIGAVSTLFIYPLNWEMYGDIQLFIASASLLVPFLSMGVQSIVNKYYPYFEKHNSTGFIRLLLMIALRRVIILSLVIIPLVFFMLKYNIIESRTELPTIYILSVIMVFISIFRIHCSNMKRIVVPDIFTKFFVKIFIPLIFLLSVYDFFHKGQIILALIFLYGIIMLCLIIYLKKINAFDIQEKEASKLFKTNLKSKMNNYMLYNSFSHIGSSLSINLDKVMIGNLLSSLAVGLYTPFLFLNTLMDIPLNAINYIANPIVSKHFESDKLFEIEQLYKSTAVNLILVGVFIFSIIWLNLDFILSIMTNGKDLIPYKILFVILTLSKMTDMATSINTSIITFSPFYKYNILFVFILGLAALVSNFYFISLWGIIGAGIATACSVFIYNVLKVLFINIKYKIHPFSYKLTYLVLPLIIVFLTERYFFEDKNLFLRSTTSSLLFSFFYLFFVYKIKISKELNYRLNDLINFITSR